MESRIQAWFLDLRLQHSATSPFKVKKQPAPKLEKSLKSSVLAALMGAPAIFEKQIEIKLSPPCIHFEVTDSG
ncbi:MAG: hypothetical protein P8X79_09285 [Reinekea sp.]